MSADAERLLSGEAWSAFCDRLKGAGEGILGEAFPAGPRERAEGFRWLTRLLRYALRMEVEAGDPRHPCFVRYETPHEQWGGPNPDNLYLRANIDARESYRVWADVRGVRQLIVSLNEGDMQLGELGVYGECSLDQLDVEADGRLELWISADERPGNWIAMHPKARLVTLRVCQSDWERDAGPVFHIERVGAAGVPPPPLAPEVLARSLDRAATWVERTSTFWNAYTKAGWERSTPNVAAPARATPGGADHILYGSCFWELAPDEALLVECEVPEAGYWNFVTHTLGWLESGDFADRQTSLSDQQAHVDADGRVRMVLAHRDPGTPNWLDTEERPRGLLVYRWVWARTNPEPRAEVVPIAKLRDRLPADHPLIDAEDRRLGLARRREAAWNRFL